VTQQASGEPALRLLELYYENVQDDATIAEIFRRASIEDDDKRLIKNI
jgi:truncated hemoglobin YjbI